MAQKSMKFDFPMKNAVESIDESKKEHSMKAAKATNAMGKIQIARALSAKCGHRITDMLQVLDALMVIATAEVKERKQFAIPGIATIRKRYKPGRSAGKIVFRGKEVRMKAKAAHYQIKACATRSFKNNVE